MWIFFQLLVVVEVVAGKALPNNNDHVTDSYGFQVLELLEHSMSFFQTDPSSSIGRS